MTILKELCERIHLQKEMEVKVLDFYGRMEENSLRPFMDQLFSKDTWEEGRASLCRALEPDPQGVKILTCMLLCGLQTWKKYESAGISQEIFVETFRCFPRFIREHEASYSVLGFDRDFWTSRQIAMRLFRLGELEYELLDELVDESEVRKISIHIPSDAEIQTEKVRASYRLAKEFMKNYFPEYEKVPMVCESWLLAPALKQVLPAASNIVKFQDLFRIEQVLEEDTEYLGWVFKRKDLPVEQLPQDTSLQRNLKKYLMEGGKVGAGIGTLEEDRL